MTRVRCVLACLGLMAGGWGAASRADDPPPTKDPPAAAEPLRLTTASLGLMLTDLGYEPKLGEDRFQKIRATAKDWTSPVWLSVSGSGRTVWLYTEFDLRPDFDKAPADAWRRLLEKNDDIIPAFFSLDEKGRRVSLRQPVHNAGVTPAQLRKQIAAFVDVIQKTQDLWRPWHFLPPLTVEARKVLDDMAGTWTITASTDKGKPGVKEVYEKLTVVVEKNQVRFVQDGQDRLKATLYLEVKDGVICVDLLSAGGTDVGILKIDRDTLTLCTASSGSTRPTKFASTEAANSLLMVLARQKP
ncbi:MAG: hypothetical protein JWO38_2249 [Gemmataceae bacterium]|nr:hypothetical protein [Gemmataceae bacterium]